MLNKWHTAPKMIDDYMGQNIVFGYDKSLNGKQISNDLCIPQKIYDLRKAAEIHKRVRRHIQSILRPGMLYTEICNEIENKTVELCNGQNDMKIGSGFPTGLSVNNIVAHDSAWCCDDTRRLKENDVCKIDFGTHVNGYIIDSAFTVAYNPRYEPLLKASKESMWNAIKLAGPDASINDIASEIKSTIEAYEIEIDGHLYPIKPVWNLGGHNIKQYEIHGGQIILNAPHDALNGLRMNEGQIYAIETFATTGKGQTSEDTGVVTHYGINYMNPKWSKINVGNSKANKLLDHIKKRNTLPFCTRWIRRDFGEYKQPIDVLLKKGIIQQYPPLIDIPGSYSAQFEHTLYLHEFGKEILSAGDDY